MFSKDSGHIHRPDPLRSTTFIHRPLALPPSLSLHFPVTSAICSDPSLILHFPVTSAVCSGPSLILHFPVCLLSIALCSDSSVEWASHNSQEQQICRPSSDEDQPLQPSGGSTLTLSGAFTLPKTWQCIPYFCQSLGFFALLRTT